MIKYICIHHSAVNSENKQLDAVNTYHKQQFNMLSKLGWYVGYNYFIDVDGTVTQTREIGEETAAVIGHNKDTIHICVAGDFNYEYPWIDLNGIIALAKLLNTLKQTYKVPVKFHRELQKNRTCPGTRFTEQALKDILNIDFVDVEKQEKIKELQTLMGKLKNLLEQLRLKYESRNN